MRWRKRKKMRAQWFSFFRARNSFKKRFVLWILLFLCVTDESNRKWAWFLFFFSILSKKKKKALSPLLVIYPTARTRARKHKNAGAYVCLFLPLSSPHPLPLKLIILFFLPVSKRGKKSMNFYIAASSTRAQRTRKKKSAIVFQQAYRLPLTCAWHRKALD